MTNATLTPSHSAAARVAGRIVAPSDPGWDDARQAWNLAVDQRPALVALPETAVDVAAIVRYAGEHGLRVAAQGTGHNAHPLEGTLEDTVLVKTAAMRGVEIDPIAMVARVEAGVLWADVTAAAAEHGLAALAGSSPDVGVVGYTLGGGISWLGRRYGLAASSVIAADVVTADGEIVRADRRHNQDLFWALRGGGGSFGVVTALEFLLYPVAEVYAGALFFEADRAVEVIEAWRREIAHFPDEITSVARVLHVPPIPDVPEFLRGRSFTVIEAASLLDAEVTSRYLAPLRALGPEMDTFETAPATALSQLHMDPDHPVPGKGDHRLLGGLDRAAIEAFAAAAQPPLLSLELRHLGGALARPADGALQALDAEFAMFGVGMTMDADMAAGVRAQLDVAMDAMAPWDNGREYLNFAEKATDVRRMWPAAAYERLTRTKAQYDPTDLFRSNHPVPPAR